MIESLTALGLLSAFGVNMAAAAAFEWIASKWRTAGVTNHDLQKALRESYCDALSSIEFGFQRREGLLDSLGKRRLYREITTNFDKEFLTPFISETSLSEDDFESLTQEGSKYCRILREAVDQSLPKEDVPDINIEDLLLAGRKLEGADDLRKLNDKAKADLMTKVGSVKGIPKFFFDFLDYKDLLVGSVVFFYGEKIKADERVRSIFTHAELQRIREEQSKQYQKQAAKLETALQSQMSAFQQFLSPIRDNFAEVLTCLERLEAEWTETNKYLQRILDLISLDKGLSNKDKRQLEAGLSPSFDLHAKYEFDERKPIGYGAIAAVYRALHRGLRQVRAIKVLKPEHRENQEVVERFLREAVVLGSLKHANIVQIYDAGGGGPNLDFYLEMEYVEGATLRNFIKTHEFDWERILKFIKQVGSAIQKIHDSGIIHRDLNPRNIMVDKNGDLKVMDFGVAKIIGVEGLTRDGQVVGTTDYIAPEQSRGERVDERADIYSFGVILYELCTKRLPSVPPLPLHQYQFDVPEWLEDIIARCLKPDREQRYASMKEVLAAMEAEEKRAVTPVRCAFHPQKDAVAVCVTCGKKICEDCRYTLKGKHYCHQCAEKILEIPPPVLPKPKPIVEPAPAPVLSVDCNRLDFKDVGPGSTSAKSFIVRNTGTGKLTGGVTTSREWLKVVPNRLDLDKGQKDGVSVTADATGLPYGFKDIAYVNIVTSGGSAKIRVRLSTSVVAKPAPVPVPRKRSNRKKLALFTAIGIAVLVPSLLIITPRANKVLNVHSDTSAPVISSVQVTSATENSAVITWATDERSTTWAMFNAPELGFSLIGKEEDKNLVYNHKFEQASLEPGVWYVVTVYSTDANGNTAEEEFEFTTPGQSGTILKLIFSDDFSNPDSGWWDVTPSEGGEADAKYQDGGYRIIVKQGDSCWWMLSDKVGQLGDFVFEVDAKWLSQLASTQGCYGVAFRDQDLSSNYYMFWVNNSDQTYIIWKSINGTKSALKDWTHSGYISEGTATNRLKIVCQGAKITAYVNDEYLTTVTDYSFSKGLSGLLVGKFKGAHFDADALFDNVKIYVPD